MSKTFINHYGELRFGWFAVAHLSFFLLVVFLVATFNARVLEYPAHLRMYKQMVVVLNNVDDTSGREVLRRAVEYNEIIITAQRYNQVPILDWVYPDGYNDMKLFDLDGTR